MEKIEPSHEVFCQKCNGCKVEKPISEFISAKGKNVKNCVLCRTNNNKKNKIRYDTLKAKDPEKFKAKRKESSKRERELIKTNDERRLKRNKIAKNYREKFPEKHKKISAKQQYKDNTILYRYKKRCEKRNVPWNISREFAISLFNNLCVYCGQPDIRGKCGIDRLDNSKGYVEDNCVSCCKICNYMKKQWTCESFIAYVGHVAAFANLIACDYLVPHRLRQASGGDFSTYVTSAKARGHLFELSSETFQQIVNGSCYLCGQSSSINHMNGVDRIDNNQGYLNGNVATCCFHCNNLKHELDLVKFKEHCKLIFIHSQNNVQFLNTPFEKQIKNK